MGDIDALITVISTGLTPDADAKQEEGKKEKRIQSAALGTLEPRIALLESLSIRSGLSEKQLDSLSKIAANTSLGASISFVLLTAVAADKVQARLIRCLLPTEQVSEATVIAFLGTFVSQSHATQAVFLKWLVLIFDLLTSTAAIHRLYNLFFRHLTYEILRPFLVMILYRITRREDVQPFRVRQLQALRSSVLNSDDQYLIALLLLFKDFNHDINVSVKLIKRGSLFNTPDRDWQAQIDNIQQRREDRTDADGSLAAALRFQDFKSGMRKRKAEDVDPTPRLSTIRGDASPAGSGKRKALEDMLRVTELVEYAGRTAMPAQLASLLHQPLLRHAIALDPTRSYKLRVGHWLAFMLDEELTSPPNPARTTVLLHRLVEVSEFFGELAPSVVGYLAQFLPTWLGFENVDSVLALVSFVPPMPIDELLTTLLLPLQRLYFVSSPESKSRLLHSLVSLLRNWTLVPWDEYTASPRTTELFVWAQLDPNCDYYLAVRVAHSIRDLALSIERLCTLGLQAENDHPLLQHAAASLYELMASLVSRRSMPFILFPSRGVVYRLLASSDATAVSRMCGILLQYKSEVEHLKRRKEQQAKEKEQGKDSQNKLYAKLSFSDGSDAVTHLNSYIWDFSTALWRNRLFAEKDGQYVDSLHLPQAIAKQIAQLPEAKSALSITSASAFSGFTFQFLNELAQTDDIEIHPNTVKDDIKHQYLDYLRERGLTGLYDFLCTFITSLAKIRAQ